MPRPVVALVGATASGKTGLSLDLAERLGGEVVNTDAMQVYRGMDVGTAKLPESPSAAGSRTTCSTSSSVTEPATVALFQGWARDAIADIRGRDATPVLVGGSALYTRAIVDRFEFPGTDESLRRELEVELERVGSHALHAAAGGGRPRRGRADPARQRAPRRPRPGGRRAHRTALQREPPAAGVRRPADRAGRRRHRPADARRADRPAGRGDVRRRVRRGGRGAARPRPRRRRAPRRGPSATAR